MPRFFFDTYNGDRFVPDEEGCDLGGIEEAKAEAVKVLPEMARDDLPNGDHREFVVDVLDEGGDTVLRARLSLVVECLPDGARRTPSHRSADLRRKSTPEVAA